MAIIIVLFYLSRPTNTRKYGPIERIQRQLWVNSERIQGSNGLALSASVDWLIPLADWFIRQRIKPIRQRIKPVRQRIKPVNLALIIFCNFFSFSNVCFLSASSVWLPESDYNYAYSDILCGFTVSVLGQEEGYTVKYTTSPEQVPNGKAQGNS